ncbi:MAG: iron uptake porin [Aphanocapsa sp. GSE-SYN-MK-11-07L]|nr:iron uptake porin [Aphanocapsa sp. GSE-SYN-MK-11-07L]
MKKSYLLAGSIGIFSLFAGVIPAQAASESVAPAESAAAALAPIAPAAPGPNLALAPVTPASPEAPTVLAPIAPVATDATEALSPIAPAAIAPASTPLVADASQQVTSVDQLANNDASMGQVTSVSQLSDVQPTDWAFQAVQSLVEKYGCIVGYPDSTFRGNRAATRFELAAALNACLDVISDRFATKEDLATLRKLQEEFAAELATLRGRVDGLEARTAQLEATQFSTTTKLQGTAVMSFQAGAVNGRYVDSNDLTLRSGDRFNPTVIAAVLLSFNTSFSGDDLLQTTLAFGNNGLDTIAASNIGTTGIAGGLASDNGVANAAFFNPGQYYWSGFGNQGILYRLAYTFKPFKDVTITAGPQFYPSDIIDFNSYANAPASDFGSYFFINNPFIVPYAMNFAGGAGAAVQWNPGAGPFTVKVLYMAANANNPIRGLGGDGTTNGGFAGDPYQASAEVQFANTFSGGKNSYAIRLQYTNATTFNVNSNAIGLNAEMTLGKLGIFGRFGYAFLNAPVGFNPVPYSDVFPTGVDSDFEAITFMGGVAYKDLFVPGALAGVAAGAPMITYNANGFSKNGQAINDATQVNVEAFYRFPVSDNISITPIFTAIFNPNNSTANDPVYQGVLRTTFTF